MEYFHIVNRGIDKRKVFLDDKDRWRFIHSLFVFNNTKNIDPNHRLKNWKLSKTDRTVLVHIHAFCLMDNHYHLLISPLVENGLPLFMKKLNMGYAKYFNERNNRTGYLWQGKYRKQYLTKETHFMYIPFYIHCNPLDYKFPSWRNSGVKDTSEALKYLKEYKWSSHLDYLGIKNIPSVLHKNELQNIFGTPKQYEKKLKKTISSDLITEDFSIYE